MVEFSHVVAVKSYGWRMRDEVVRILTDDLQ